MKKSFFKLVLFFLMVCLSQFCYAAESKPGTSLFTAVKNCQINTVRNLVSKGANVNAADIKGNTPLIYAVQTGSADIVRILVNSGAKVNQKNNDGNSAMDCAAEYATDANLEIIKILEKAGGRLNANSSAVLNGLKKAINSGNVSFAKKLLDKGANVNAKIDKKMTFLFLAATLNNPDMVDVLLDAGANVNIGTNDIGTPLCAAIVGDINGQDYSSLEFNENSLKIARMLIDSGANVNLGTKKENLTPLFWACAERSCNPEMVILLLESGADINKASVDNKSLQELTKTSEGNKININKYSQVMRILKNPKIFTNKQ